MSALPALAMASAADARAEVRLREFSVRNFRNLARVELAVPAAGVALLGDNGHGKTNLLEAIYYLQLFRSVRGARDADCVRFGDAAFHLSAEVDGTPATTVACGFAKAGKRKKVVLDGVEITRLADALGAVPSVMIAPRDVALVSGAPSERRRYMDVMLALASRHYLIALQRYRRALERRNAALRDLLRQGQRDEERVAVWEVPLAESGATIVRARRSWVDAHSAAFAELCDAIGERGAARMRYVCPLAEADDPRDALLHALEEKRALDMRRGLTHAGPHRDEIELTLAGDDGTPRELRLFGSAGQQRTAAFVLRLLEARTLRDAHGLQPVMLLDDPFAELDARRSARILTLLRDAGLGQTILAVPRAEDIPPSLLTLERWTVRDGALARSSA